MAKKGLDTQPSGHFRHQNPRKSSGSIWLTSRQAPPTVDLALKCSPLCRAWLAIRGESSKVAFDFGAATLRSPLVPRAQPHQNTPIYVHQLSVTLNCLSKDSLEAMRCTSRPPGKRRPTAHQEVGVKYEVQRRDQVKLYEIPNQLSLFSQWIFFGWCNYVGGGIYVLGTFGQQKQTFGPKPQFSFTIIQQK